MYCKNLLVRKKNYKPYFYCKEFRRVIILTDCEKCSKLILRRNSAIKKVKKDKIVVKKEIYEQVYNRDKGQCRICGTTQNLHLHHIKYRSERRDLINEPSNLIMLCAKHHQEVHSNKHKWQSILKEMVESD